MASNYCIALSVACLCLVTSRAIGYQSQNHGSCSSDPSKDIIQVNSIRVSPYPIQVGQTVYLTVNATVLRDIQGVMDLEVDIYRVGIVDVPINLGPFTDVCSKLPRACPQVVRRAGIPCSCPIQTGTYVIRDAAVPVRLPSVSGGWSFIRGILGGVLSGEYRGTLTLRDRVTRQSLVCYRLTDVQIQGKSDVIQSVGSSIKSFFTNLFG